MPLKKTGAFLLVGFRRAEGMAVLLVGRYDEGRFKFAGKVSKGLRGVSRLELVAPEELRLTKASEYLAVIIGELKPLARCV